MDSFNPYFPGVTFQRRSMINSCIFSFVVSILIFLELPFKELTGVFPAKSLQRFNPYFPGVTFQSVFENIFFHVTRKFQSLFSWSYLSKRVTRGYSDKRGGFQSLFSWSYLSKRQIFRIYQRAAWVSILIFLELPFKDVRREDDLLIANKSFNPYFPGVTFQRVGRGVH